MLCCGDEAEWDNPHDLTFDDDDSIQHKVKILSKLLRGHLQTSREARIALETENTGHDLTIVSVCTKLQAVMDQLKDLDGDLEVPALTLSVECPNCSVFRSIR